MRALVMTCCLPLLVGACAETGYVLTKTGEAGRAKLAGCDFVVVTTKVERPYREIGILDSRVDPPTDAATFKDQVRAEVCSIGGDAVVAEISGSGRYVRGTVLRWTGEASEK